MTQQIEAFTLVDITNTGTVRVCDNNKKEYHQQQNLNALIQTISLRSQPLEPVVTVIEDADLKSYNFDESFGPGPHRVWKLRFYVEHEVPWTDGNDDLAFLKSDAHGIAITSDLDNTADFLVNMFDTTNCCNLYFVMS